MFSSHSEDWKYSKNFGPIHVMPPVGYALQVFLAMRHSYSQNSSQTPVLVPLQLPSLLADKPRAFTSNINTVLG